MLLPMWFLILAVDIPIVALSTPAATASVSAAGLRLHSEPVLRNAHAHNDYYHRRPLMDAVDRGFTSVEADVFLVDGNLLVAHSPAELSADRTLEDLYLKPLQQLVQSNGGRVYRNGPSMILLVDIKANGRAAYAVLHELLARYSELISHSTDNVYVEKAVTVIVSGDRAFQEIKTSNPRYAAIDGRLSDLESDAPPALMPLISDNWNNHFKYRGDGVMSDAERQKLKQLVAAVHAKGRRMRFWATPENPVLWKELRSAEVDLIGTDNLDQLRRFLTDETQQ